MADVRSTQIVRETGANPTDTPARDTSVAREVAALRLYTQRDRLPDHKQLAVYGLFTREFYEHRDGNQPQEPLNMDPEADDRDYFASAYIRAFANEAACVSTALLQRAQVEDFIIWNEPDRENDPAGYLPPANFAALLCRCWRKMETAPRIYWGGVFFGNDLQNPDVPDQRALDYISDVYQAMEDAQIPGFGYGAWPWTGINIHVHGNRTDQHFSNLFSALDGIRATRNDTGPVIVGEWGIHVGTDPNQLSNIYAKMKYHTIKMFFHSHHAIPPYPYPQVPDWGLRYYSWEAGRFLLGIRTDADLWDAYEAVVTQ